jgi:uncharacterized HAD superfamily protein
VKISPSEIAFDIDGVFADTFRLFVEKARKDYGYSLQYEDITEYEFEKVIEIDERVSQKILQTLVEHPLESGIRAIPGAVNVLTRLSRFGPILFVTARTEKNPILDWIHHQLAGVSADLIHLEATETHQNKPAVLTERGIRYFVDDRLETCYLLDRYAVTPIVFDQPWNRRPHPFTVVRNWDEISAMIRW